MTHPDSSRHAPPDPQDLAPNDLWGGFPSRMLARLTAMDPFDPTAIAARALLIPMVARKSALRIFVTQPAVTMLLALDDAPVPADQVHWPTDDVILFEFCEPIPMANGNTQVEGIILEPLQPDGTRTALVPMFDKQHLSVRALTINKDTFEVVPDNDPHRPAQPASAQDLTATTRYRHLIHLTTSPETQLEPLPLTRSETDSLRHRGAENPWQIICPRKEHPSPNQPPGT